ncbi:MAG: rane protein insertase, YidC/Oxa1 family [Myxococcales bacterium]|nr:rane protein insertase, YidC/Oxa1 family [Myxococcales bacterium]
MQDQGKRLLLAVSLALGFMLIWQNFIAKKPDEPPAKPTAGSQMAPIAKPTSQVGVGDQTPPTTTPSTTTPSTATPSTTTPSTTQPEPVAPPSVTKPRGPESVITVTHPGFTAQFSSYGGVLKSWHLTDPRYINDPSSKGELVPQLPGTGEFNVNFASSTYVLPVSSEWTGTKVSDTEIRYTISTEQLDVVKTYVLVPDAFLVKMTVKVTVKVPANVVAHQTLALTSYGFQDPNAPHESSRGVQARVWESSTLLRDGTLLSTPIQSLLEFPRYEPNIQWTGFEHPYLLVGFAPNPDGGIVDKHTYAQPSGLMQTDMLFPAVQVKSGDPALSREVVGYLGPKNYDPLTNADGPAGFSTGFKDVIDFGWFGKIGRPLLWLLLKFYGVVGNWGIAIIFLTLLVKGATIPFTTKSMRSMKAMAALGPQMKGLQAKYKEDRQRLQVETMALYKEHGVNPLSGCLPIFLQMPIWLALYRMLSNAGELYLQPFIPGWINDLTAPDPSHVLPIVLMVTMFAQARLTPQTTDPSQRMQQKFLQYGMPLMFGVMSFFFPSGLTLYIFTNTCLSALHSLYMNKFDKKSLEIAERLKKSQAAAESKVVAKDVRNAKDANPKPAPADTTNDADDDEDSENEPSVNAKERTPRVGPARSKRKKARRR